MRAPESMTTCANCGHKSEEDFRFCPECGMQSIGGAASTGLIGRTLREKYRVLEQIGEGSMGTVYLAEHVSLKKKIAVKVLHKDLHVSDETLQRFQREGIAAGQFTHPNAIQIFDFDRADDRFFLAMEYVEGVSLKEWLAQHGELDTDAAINLLRQLLSTLAQAHAHGIVHRDLKPENLMVAETETGELSLKVLDFGLSKLVDRPLDASLLTMPGRVMGTPLYMAPEQWRGEEIDHRTDLYSAGLILYELLTGKQPFKGGDMTETMVKSTTQPPPPLLEARPDLRVPADLDTIVSKALAKSRDDRFQTAAEMLEALDDVRFDRLARARSGRARRSRRGSAPRPASGFPMRTVAAAAAVVALAAAGYLALSSWAGNESDRSALVRAKPVAERSLDEKNYLALLDETRDQLRTQDTSSALAAAEKALRMECADAEAYLVRAAVFRQRGEEESALADLREALQMSPAYGAAEAAIGWIHFDAGALDQAETRFTAATDKDARCGDAWAGRGAVLCARDEPKAAKELLEPVAADLEDAARVHLFLGEAHLALGEPEAAVQSFVRAKRSDSQLWRAYAGLGRAYLRKGDRVAAEAQLRGALGLNENAHGARRALAELMIADERFDEAFQVLTPALRANNDDGDLHVLRALIDQAQDDRSAALRSLETALVNGVEDTARVRALAGALLLREEKWASAVDHLQRATDLDGSLTGALIDLGIARIRLTDHKGAAEALEQAIENDPANTFANYTLGVLYMDYLERPEDALDRLRAYRNNGGSNARVDEWIQRLDH